MKSEKATTRSIRRKNRELVARLAAGDKDAPEELAETNMPLVMHIAAKKGYGFLGVDDLTYHGREAILHAAEKFDPSRGADFGTYAGYWIRNRLDDAVREIMQLIRIPAVMSNRIYQVEKISEKLERLLGRRPTEAEIAEELDLSPKQVHACLEAPTGTISLQSYLGEEGEGTVEDLVPDADVTPPWAELESMFTSKWVYSLVDKALKPREKFIISLRYGLEMPDGTRNPPMTLQELSEVVGLTRERVRQIIMQALRKLRELAELEEAEIGAGFRYGT